MPHSSSYRNIQRFSKAEQPDEVLVIRFDDQLYFGNADYFKEMIIDIANEKADSLKLLVVDASSIHDVDSTGLLLLEQLINYFQKKKITVAFSGIIGPVRDKLLKTGMMKIIGERNQFLKIHDAITYYQNLKKGTQQGWSPEAIQSNKE